MANHHSIAIFLVLCAALQAYGQSFNCTQAGRFADPTDTTCQNYTYCVYIATTNTFVSYNYVCPTTSVFNPATSMCTAPTNYVCTVTTTVPTTSAPTTTDSPTTTAIPTTTVAADPCTADGFVADPSSTDCSSYIQCVQINGTFDETTLTCPNGTFYNPNDTFCESTYVCTSETTTTITTAAPTTITTAAPTTITTAAPTTVAPFSCTATGRFANPADTGCKTYYYCVATTTGTFAQYLYTCPSTSVFSPTTGLCTTNYVCPTTAG